MNRTPLRVEPISTYPGKLPQGDAQRADPARRRRGRDGLHLGPAAVRSENGEIKRVPLARQAELVLQQMKLAFETAGSSLDPWSNAMSIARPAKRISPRSTTPMTATFRPTRRRGFSCTCRCGPGRSTFEIDWRRGDLSERTPAERNHRARRR